jgi:acetolactate synthase I/II/III large subunit
MKASDYVANYLYQNGVTHIYEVIGGMITHLIDSADRHGRINLISCHHEQAAAFAAYGMGRTTGIPGVAMATSGPGAINLLNGIASCYFDSVPAIFITGQVNTFEQKGQLNIRQLGFQETDIVSIAKPITKAAWMVTSPDQLPDMLDDAFRLALSDRPGPVLLDIPMDVQRGDVPGFPKKCDFTQNFWGDFTDDQILDTIFSEFNLAKKPLILAGGGILAAKMQDPFRQLVKLINVPVVNSLMAVDALPHSDLLYSGLIGSYGNRWANKAFGECDMLLVLGSRLDIRQTGADTKFFENGRKIFHVDCESGEINNRIKGCVPIITNLRSFIPKALQVANELTFENHSDWLCEIQEMKQQYPDNNEIIGFDGINPNYFMHELSKYSQQAAGFVTDVGNNQMWAAQSVDLSAGQQFLTSGGMGSMGFSLPTAIGFSFSSAHKPVVQITGDGGMQMNIQELETIAYHNLPIKMVVINNKSLGMVRQFQQSYFYNRYPSTYKGYSSPDFERIAHSYGIEAYTISDVSEIPQGLDKLWQNHQKPFLLQVIIDPMINAYPKIAFGYPITEMEPQKKPQDMEGT